MTDYKALELDYGLPLQPKRDLVAVRGEGACLYDEAGREYLDFAAGIGVASLGHCHPKLVAAIQQQAETLITCPNIMYNDIRSRLLEKLVEISPQNLARAYLCNSGAESIEAALKFAACTADAPTSSPRCAVSTGAPWVRSAPPIHRSIVRPSSR